MAHQGPKMEILESILEKKFSRNKIELLVCSIIVSFFINGVIGLFPCLQDTGQSKTNSKDRKFKYKKV